MNKLIILLIFLGIFLFKQSRVIEKKAVYDRVLGVEKVEYNINWNNLPKYLKTFPDKAKQLFR